MDADKDKQKQTDKDDEMAEDPVYAWVALIGKLHSLYSYNKYIYDWLPSLFKSQITIIII